MTEQEILEGNKLIAEFMGWKLSEIRIQKKEHWYKNPNKETFIQAENFEYHSSWDWLMPSIKKAIEVFGEKRCFNLIQTLSDIDIISSWHELVKLLNIEWE